MGGGSFFWPRSPAPGRVSSAAGYARDIKSALAVVKEIYRVVMVLLLLESFVVS